MGTIKQATYGDENTASDVTDTLINLYNKGGRYLELAVGPSLLKTETAGPKVSLTNAERAVIRDQAEEACGNALDTACMETNTAALTNAQLEEKSRDRAVDRITGERLTVTVVENGKQKTLVVPKDNLFRFGKKPESANAMEFLETGYDKVFNWETIWRGIGVFIYYFVWAFGTALTWIALSQSYDLPTGQISPGDYWWLKYVGTLIALLTAGYGGFVVIIVVYFVLGLMHYIRLRS